MSALAIHLTRRVSLVWAVLMLATGLSWWLGADHGQAGPSSREITTTALMLVAFFKVRLVIMHFMEIRSAPIALRLLGEAWVAITCTLVLGMYWYL